MAFDFNFLSNTGGTSPAPIIYTYLTDDSKIVVVALGYFNNGFTKLKVNDLITVVNSTEVFTVKVTAVSSTATTTQEVIMTDFYTEVAKGNVTGHSIIHKFGRNPDIDTSTFEAIWNGEGLYTGHNAIGAEIVTLSSSSADDTSAGTGAITVEVFGLDGNYIEINETVTLSGLTLVDTVNSYLRLDRMIVRTAGTGGVNAGQITAAQKVTTAVIFAVMPTGYNQTMIAAYTVPAGKRAFIRTWFASLSGLTNANCDFRFLYRPENQVFQVKEEIAIAGAGSSYIQREYVMPKDTIEAKTDLVINGNTDAPNTSLSAGFDILLIDI